MIGSRLKPAQLNDHLALVAPPVRRVVRTLRRAVLMAAPEATEAIRFGCLCYFHEAAYLGSIGGNICLIEIKGDKVELSFIQGAGVDDPSGRLKGRSKFKRFVPIASAEAATNPRIADLIRSAAELSRPHDSDADAWSVG